MGQNLLGFAAKGFSNALLPGQVDSQSALWNTSRHGKYYASVYGVSAAAPGGARPGAVFRVSNQAAAAITAALATTYTGLCLSNPAGSGVNLAVKRVSAILGPGGPISSISVLLRVGQRGALLLIRRPLRRL